MGQQSGLRRSGRPSDEARDSAQIDAVVALFEDGWQRGERPSIDDLFKPHDENLRLLIELVHTELELRLKAAEPVRIEEYLNRYPLLGAEQELIELIEVEYNLRRRLQPELSIDEFMVRFPDQAEELARRLQQPVLPARKVVNRSCPYCQTPVATTDPNSEEIDCPECGTAFYIESDFGGGPTSGQVATLGKFALLDLVGRGSFGTVYRARDTELDRIVALKIPRNTQFASSEEEDRFVREARAAAQLRHPAIVAVYDVGRTEGHPYIVAEFVEGSSLQEMLDHRRFSFRESAELIAQVSEAVSHAHLNGVVHRDLKPSNIMLEHVETSSVASGGQRSSQRGAREPTVTGLSSELSTGSTLCRDPNPGEVIPPTVRPRVTDFGLARRTEGEPTVTLEGQLLGTPAYMSPEQARGQAHRADGRSDVYSLGVILFELLTGERPFRGTREMLVYQTIHDDPQTPRRLNGRIPRDLETITLKCLAKEPGRRYDSAAELAEDLKRWIASKPIMARPFGSFERTWRWAHRNPRIAGLATALVVVLVAGMTAVTFLWRRAEANYAEAEILRKESSENFQMAWDAVDVYLDRVAREPRLKEHGLERLRRELLESAEQFYGAFVERNGRNANLKVAHGRAYMRLAEITDQIGPKDEAIRFYQLALEIFQSLSRVNPSHPGPRSDRAECEMALGRICASLGRNKRAEESFRAAIVILDDLVTRFPGTTEFQGSRASGLLGLGSLYEKTGRAEAAKEAYQETLVITERVLQKRPGDVAYENARASAFNNLASVYNTEGKPIEACDALDMAIEIREQVTMRNPDNPGFKSQLAGSYYNLANVLRNLDFERSRTAYQSCLTHRQQLVDQHPDISQYHQNLADSTYALGLLQAEHGLIVEAKQCLWQAVRIQERLVSKHPEVPGYSRGLSTSKQGLAVFLFQNGLLAEAEQELEELFKLTQSLANANRDTLVFQLDLAKTYNLIGLVRKRGGRPDAEEAFVSAVALCRALTQEHPRVPECQEDHAAFLNNLGSLYQSTRRFGQADDVFRQSIEIRRRLSEQHPNQPEYQGGLAKSLLNHSNLLHLRNFMIEADSDLNEAVEIFEQLNVRYPDRTDYCDALADAYISLGVSRKRRQLYAGAADAYQNALRLSESLLVNDPDNIRYQQRLATTHNNLGNVYKYSGQTEKAMTSLVVGLEIRQGLMRRKGQTPEYKLDVAASHLNLGNLSRSLGKPRDALDRYAESLALLYKLRPRLPESTDVQLALYRLHSNRSEVLEQLEDYARAVTELDEVLKLAPERHVKRFRIRRARARALAGNHSEAVDEVAELARSASSQSELYDLARVYSLSAAAAKLDGALDAETRSSLFRERVGSSLALLEESVKVGFRDVAKLRADPEFVSIRQSPAYDQLLKNLNDATEPL